ncbi:MAG: hypothetical protein B7Y83_19210 [Flavobacteriales bacterium 32-34-25]|nr:MAG: hypothetical protein B7Y83_19210 [Flavobacteriales bacterium 32-34-25]
MIFHFFSHPLGRGKEKKLNIKRKPEFSFYPSPKGSRKFRKLMININVPLLFPFRGGGKKRSNDVLISFFHPLGRGEKKEI